MTNAVMATLGRLVHDLDSLDLDWALIGGLAVSARAEPRFTRDVDVCVVAADDRVAERVVLQLHGLGYTVLSLVEQEYRALLATVRMAPPIASGVVVDLLFASSGVEPEIAAAAERIELLPGLTVPVARAGHLAALKLLSRDPSRPQDAADLIALRPVLTASDEADVLSLAQLITQRGFNRERDLDDQAAAYVDEDPSVPDAP